MLILTVSVCLTVSAGAQDSWKFVNTPSQRDVTAIVTSSEGTVFAATFGDAVYRSNDSGDNWTPLNAGLSEPFVWSLAINSSNDLFAGVDFSGGVYRSTDQGDSWSQVLTGSGVGRVEALAVDPAGALFAGTLSNGLYRSTDNGGTWTQIGFADSLIASIAVTEGNIFIVTWDGVLRSTDQGDSWIQTSNTDDVSTTLAAGSNGNVFAGTWGNGVYRSEDLGQTWREVSAGLSNLYIRCFAVAPDGVVYVGTNGGGVFRSRDGGDSWTAVNDGLSDLYVYSLAAGPDGFIYAGTGFGWVFRLSQTASGRETSSRGNDDFGLQQNYPNPFGAATEIRFELARPTRVVIHIIDLLGREAGRLQEGYLLPGPHTVQWRAAGLPSGVYQYRIVTDSWSETRRAVLAR